MREIKFRAWDKEKKKMYSPEKMGQDELQINPDGRGFFNAHCGISRLSEYYPHLIPLQYTGLKDKNGKEIYEGDILNTTNKGKCIVRFDRYLGDNAIAHQGFCLELANEEGFESLDGSLEIIGNIYKNPNLIK